MRPLKRALFLDIERVAFLDSIRRFIPTFAVSSSGPAARNLEMRK